MRILYGIAGEGLGHATRSKVVIEHLEKKGHKIIAVCGGKAYDFMKKFFKTERIECLRITFINNKVKRLRTILSNLIKFPFKINYNKKLNEIIEKFKPDLIIMDFEPFTAYYARRHKKPLISIDNQHILTNTFLDYHNPVEHYIAKSLVKIFIPEADYTIITSYFYPRISKKNTFLVPLILRKEVLKIKPSLKEHILVYMSTNNEKFLPILKKLNEKFVVYGLNKSEKIGNIELKKFNEKTFINDLSSSKAVITNGGLSTIGESLYFKKPILCIPIKNHYEQMLNAMHIEKSGYGLYAKKLKQKNIKNFLDNLKKYRKSLEHYKVEDNSKLFTLLDTLLKTYQ